MKCEKGLDGEIIGKLSIDIKKRTFRRSFDVVRGQATQFVFIG
jgi:hypothetical protein